MYRVIKMFTDLQDKGYRYQVGDTYPRKGLTADKKRIEQLSSAKNRQKTALIEEVVEKVEKTSAKVEKTSEKPKQTRKTKSEKADKN